MILTNISGIILTNINQDYIMDIGKYQPITTKIDDYWGINNFTYQLISGMIKIH